MTNKDEKRIKRYISIRYLFLIIVAYIMSALTINEPKNAMMYLILAIFVMLPITIITTKLELKVRDEYEQR